MAFKKLDEAYKVYDCFDNYRTWRFMISEIRHPYEKEKEKYCYLSKWCEACNAREALENMINYFLSARTEVDFEVICEEGREKLEWNMPAVAIGGKIRNSGEVEISAEDWFHVLVDRRFSDILKRYYRPYTFSSDSE
jgi:hypothetical protein